MEIVGVIRYWPGVKGRRRIWQRKAPCPSPVERLLPTSSLDNRQRNCARASRMVKAMLEATFALHADTNPKRNVQGFPVIAATHARLFLQPFSPIQTTNQSYRYANRTA